MKLKGIDYPDYPERYVERGFLGPYAIIYAYTVYGGHLYRLEVNGDFRLMTQYTLQQEVWVQRQVVLGEPGTTLFGDLLMELML